MRGVFLYKFPSCQSNSKQVYWQSDSDNNNDDDVGDIGDNDSNNFLNKTINFECTDSILILALPFIAPL